jgi:hypothetical protein
MWPPKKKLNTVLGSAQPLDRKEASLIKKETLKKRMSNIES